MVMLDIKPMHNDAWSCLEDIIISTVSWLGYRHEPMFCDAWNFCFSKIRPGLSDHLGERLHEGEDHSRQNLERYVGIRITPYRNIDTVSALEKIRKELGRNYPVIIFIDAFCCPWCRVYNQHHIAHACLAIGFDGKKIVCLDPYTIVDILYLSLENFSNGYSGYAEFRIQENFAATIDWRKILKDAAGRILRYENELNPLVMMRQMADEITQSLDLEKETINSTVLMDSPFFEKLKYLSRRRLQFSQLLTYLYIYMNVRDVQPVINRFEQAAQSWDIIRNILMKYYYMPDVVSLRIKAANKIKEAAVYEEKLANDLLLIAGN